MRSDMAHSEVAEAILVSTAPEVKHRLEDVDRIDPNTFTQHHIQYRLEAQCRALCGTVAAHTRVHHPKATLEDILTVATLVERKRSPST